MKLITVVPVNVGNWKKVTEQTGVDRGDGWREYYFHEAVFNWSWLPPNCYGKLAVELKESGEREGRIEVLLAWVKAVRDGGRGKFIHLEGSEIVVDEYESPVAKKWELYETDYFPLPDWKGPILLYLMGRPQNGLQPAVAMFTLAVFEGMMDEVA